MKAEVRGVSQSLLSDNRSSNDDRIKKKER